MNIRIDKENCVGFIVENGFIVFYKGGKKLFKISNTENNRKQIIRLLRG